MGDKVKGVPTGLIAEPVGGVQGVPQGLLAQQLQQSAPAQPTATISARQPGMMSWLEDLQGDIRHGTGMTLPGRVLQKMGAPGIDMGVNEATGEMIGGPAIGPVKVAHGIGTVFSGHPIRGANEALEGVGQTLAPLVGATNPEFLPSLVTYGGLQKGVQTGAELAGADPDTAEFIGNASTLGIPLAKAKAKPVGAFIARNAPTIGKVIGTADAIGAGATAIGTGHPIAAIPAAGAAYKYSAPAVMKAARVMGPQLGAMGDAIPNPVKWPVIGSMVESLERPMAGALRSAPIEAPASSVRQPLALPLPVIDGEYVPDPARVLPRGSGPIVTPQGEEIPDPRALPSARGRRTTTVTPATPPTRPIAATPLSPSKSARLPNVVNGESAARHYLTGMPANVLTDIAKQRGLDLSGYESHDDLLNGVVDTLSDGELKDFADQAAERSRFPVAPKSKSTVLPAVVQRLMSLGRIGAQ